MKVSWEYVAGFFDGEGCINKFGRHHKYTRATIKQKTREVLDNIKEFTGMGQIYFDKHDNCYQYVIFRQEEVFLFLDYILPYLIVKREDAENADIT